MDKPKHFKTNYFAPHLELLGQGSGEARTRGEEFRPLSPDFPPCGGGATPRAVLGRAQCVAARRGAAGPSCAPFARARGAGRRCCPFGGDAELLRAPARWCLCGLCWGARDSPFCPFCGVGVVLSRVISPLGHSSASLGQIAARGGPSRAASWVGSPGRQEGAAWRAAPREPPAPHASPRRAFEERRGPGL